MTRPDSLIEDAKVVYLLALCDLILDRLSCSAGYEVVLEALVQRFVNNQTNNAEYFFECA